MKTKFPIWLEQRDEEELKVAIKAIASTSDENSDPLVEPDAQDSEWLGKSTANLSNTQKDQIVGLGLIKKLAGDNIHQVIEAIRSGIIFEDLIKMVAGEPSVVPRDITMGDTARLPDSNPPGVPYEAGEI